MKIKRGYMFQDSAAEDPKEVELETYKDVDWIRVTKMSTGVRVTLQFSNERTSFFDLLSGEFLEYYKEK